MSTWDGDNKYYSGQGVVLIARRNALTGKPLGFLPLGNVSSLKIAIATSTIDHKESQTGQRGVDKRLTTETKCNLDISMENFNNANLAMTLRGDVSIRAAASVTGDVLALYHGKILALARMGVTSVVLKQNTNTLTLYANDQTAYDYKLNADAGSVLLNDGSATPQTANMTIGGAVPSAVTVGATTSITCTHASAVGDYVALAGFAGADAALLNGKSHRITEVTGTTAFKVATNTLGKTITIGTPLAVFDGTAMTVDYTYSAQTQLDALTQGATERYLRFEGLNTADENKPVVVEVFKFAVDPLKELSLIADTIQQFNLAGVVLADPLQATGSKFFRETLLA